KEEQLSGNIKLYDIDHEAACANEAIGNRLSTRPDVPGKWAYKAVKSLGEALTGADFVIISILPGTLDEMESDVHAPEQFGIYQSVGDTVGPGGYIRALRSIPMFIEIAGAIKQYSPDAWVINYTNPMSICTRALYAAFPGIKAFGCCHEVFGTQGLLAVALNDILGLKIPPREEISINVLGINHFTWVTRASWRDIDLFPVYREFADKYFETGFPAGEHINDWEGNYFCFNHRVKFDLFRKYGAIAAAGDRHLAEFFPPIYLKNPETAKYWKFHLTPVSFRKGKLADRLARSRRLQKGEEEIQLHDTGEESVRQIKALVGLGDLITNVNLPNLGQMEGMPHGAVVETNAVFGFNHVTPVVSGKLPPAVHELVARHISNQENIIKAVLNEDKELAFEVFCSDPLITLGKNKARELFEIMLKNTAKYLPPFLK
ncbi:MAG TPA: alpha-glucosidase/alpha-galactosidase, partial [Clostridia bacterium]|nr:alpha-glucosidase/alpha-galactosidase [Clostridia bacterium]